MTKAKSLPPNCSRPIKETGLAVTGPNCLGNLSAGENLFTNIDDRVVTMEAGPVAIAGQSGAIVMAIRQALEDRGVGVGYMVTTGNEAGLETPDLMTYFAADPSIRVIVVYLEGVRNTKAFREACKAARAAGKPVIALKLGASEGGRAAAMAHTGALAGSIETFDAISTREGVIRAPRHGRIDRDHRMLRPCRAAEGRTPCSRDPVGRQARPPDRCFLVGRHQLCAVEPECQRETCKNARARQHRRQPARCRIRRGGRSFRLYAVDQDHDRRSRHRHRRHRFRTAESAA